MAELTQQRILERATEIVRAEGVGGLGLRRLARDLDVTAPALYGYYENLDHIVRALAATQFAVLAERFATIRARRPESRMRAQSRVYIDYALEEPELFRLLFTFPPDLAGSGVEHELPIATQVFGTAAATLDDGMAAGDFRAQDSLIASLTVWSCVHGCATALNMGFEFDAATRNALIENVLDTLVAGLR